MAQSAVKPDPVLAVVDPAEPGPESLQAHRAKAWEFFRSIGSPKLHVAPMVDQSELAFRMLCRENGATAAYTPMLHGRIFSESAKYRDEFFTTCPTDRPLFAQFCGNDASILLSAADHLQDRCDAVDLNFGCPQRIAKKGKYGAFLMDDLEHLEQMVTTIAAGLRVPLTCKIRIFPDLDKTVKYAQMLERSGCQLLAVHGRTRDQKDARSVRADWNAIKAVRESIGIPMLANGDIQTLEDAHRCMEFTGADGVMSADPLLANPALFSSSTPESCPWAEYPATRGAVLLLRYLELVDQYETPPRIIRAHMHKMLGDWLQEHVDLREQMTGNIFPSTAELRPLVEEIIQRIRACGRPYPIKVVTDRKKLQLKRKAEAEADQQREDEALAALDNRIAATTTVLQSPERISQAC